MIPDSEHRDAELSRRFAQQASALDADSFVNQVQLKVNRLRRARRWQRAAAWLAAAGLLVCVTPWVVSLSLIIGDWFGTALAAPTTWVLSLPLAIWVWRRSRLLA
ncbi:MAG TPA: hypothetical protein VK505_06270 [Steroidobacteraceae bacterium]|nr:hypothetical protein [Steroidobacteraceae bacterium]